MKEKAALKTRHYPEAFKKKVVEEYLITGVSKVSLLKKYDIRMRSGIQKWMKQLGYQDIHQKAGYLSSPKISILAASKTNSISVKEPDQSLEARIKELERQLEDEQLLSEAYQRMIDIAEKEFNIPIKKKRNTK